ncbi:MAG: Stp1/IreP family PP2C-type Ser/Thr phosphatase, partial [Gemmatimonadaceae bacterium]
MPANGEVIVQVFGRTDVGRTREHNEDAFVVADLTTNNATLQPEVRTHVSGPRGTLFMVADGMGGAAAGEIASAMAIEVVVREMQRLWIDSADTSGGAFAHALREATATTNAEIHAFALRHPEYRGMGTTATIAGLLGDTLYLAQVGDSRAYIVRDGVARQITKDQSLIQKLVEAGELTEEEAAVSERRNIILQALGPEAQVRVDLTHQQVRRGDVLVLCSDGLSGQVSKEQIAAVVTAHDDLVTVCKTLIDMANEAGGPDNITVIAARFDGSGLADAVHDDHVGHRVYTPSGTRTVSARTVEMASFSEDGLPVTSEMEAAPRRSQAGRSIAQAAAAAAASAGALAGDGPGPRASMRETAGVMPRGRGRWIAGVLLALLIAGGAWYLWHTAKKVVP